MHGHRINIALSAAIAGLVAFTAVSAIAAFKDAHDQPPAGWTGHVFRLSQDYPTSLPQAGSHPWTQFDFKNPTEAPKYMQAVLDYCLAGNSAANAEDNFADVGHNSVRKWYHAPWLDAGPKGREFIHGMTSERPSRKGELGPAQTQAHLNWAFGMYNPRGGYTIGRVWKDPTHPDPRKAKFPLHTVTCKFLFSTAPLTEVPFLDGSLAWQGDINRASGSGARPILRLLQVDIAVRDSRANSSIGWVFGTFQYEKAASPSTNWWEHLVPVGLTWGNDLPNLLANHDPTMQWINASRGQKLHIGFREKLLDGPIDNPHASCTACHGLAQIKRVDNPSERLPRAPNTDGISAAEIQRYFRDIKAGEAFSTEYVSVDYSLQLQVGIANAIDSGQATLPPNLAISAPHTAAVAGSSTHAAQSAPVATQVEPMSRGD
jgi:hypothetical protein